MTTSTLQDTVGRKPSVVQVELPKGFFWWYDDEECTWEISRASGTYWRDMLEWLAQYLVSEGAKERDANEDAPNLMISEPR